MKKSLLSIVSDFSEIVNYLHESDGELPPHIETALEITHKDLEVKTDSYYLIIEKLKSDARFYKEQSDKFKAAEKRANALTSQLKENLKLGMSELGLDTLPGGSYHFTRYVHSKKLVITDEKLIPDEFIITTVSKSIDKENLRKYIASGNDVEGVSLEDVIAVRSSVRKK